MHFSETVIEAGSRKSFVQIVQELWQYRALLWIFAVREIKVRYSQTVLGFGWVLITPLITVGVFTFVFGLMIKIPTDGLPYLIFYLVAIIPWYAFINVFNLTVGSIDGNVGLIKKVYFPRIMLVGAYALAVSADYFVGYFLITIFALFFGIWNIQLLVMMPILLFMQMAFAVGLGLLLAPMNTRYRDVRHFLPLCIQLFYFANPILYPLSASPPWIRFWFEINPLSVVITTYRSGLLGHWPDPIVFCKGFLMALLILMIGVHHFYKKEKDLVDVL